MPPDLSFDLSTDKTPPALRCDDNSSDAEPFLSLRQPLRRYGSIALTIAVVVGGSLMVCGHTALGKGLILGSLFSVVNFVLMAIALPMRLGRGRGPSTLISLASIGMRYALLAAPLILAAKHPHLSILTTAVGLFMIQLAILLDQLWAGWRKFVGV